MSEEENKTEEGEESSSQLPTPPKSEDWELKAAEYLAGWQRAKADYLNYKKDEAMRFEETVKFSSEFLIRDLINILDSFAALDIYIKGEPRSSADERDLEGVLLIKSQLEDILKKFGLEKIPVSAGQKFDPTFHESIVEIESNQPSGTVVEEIESGYTLHGKVISPARVKIAK